MTQSIRPLIAGNWKMNGLKSSLEELQNIVEAFPEVDNIESLICLPATLISLASEITRDTPIQIGAQDCAIEKFGAHTGDISAEMLKDAGASYVIVGHSERRIDHGEANSLIHAKAKAAWRGGLIPIICIGETLAESKKGSTFEVLANQIEQSLPSEASPLNTVIAYEPIWAIGTGTIPKEQDVAIIHSYIRSCLSEKLGTKANQLRIIYGGSVTPLNVVKFLNTTNVNGGLVGRAAMKSEDYLALLNNALS
ncbi:triose-phosphate isomerase [Brenneria goodwinii]|uniref:Triosephosphate isomerase n=1 Tax=Brenneria goodwinii TaxID=1109412 RepID=A0AAE8JKW5_9GAMM|nr:triose-phosphate isomerase [Brenneria goodwinii]ATA26457.1 triose-phosphate isomerase [Brenneria goodwinii]RLM15772.1 triose-phosphate isomerase [Brenneria goodwinii]